MPQFSTSERDTNDLYKILIGSVVPRPIAFVATRSAAGRSNLAPFSFFNAVCSNPPTLAFSVIDRGLLQKDTSRNVGEHPEFIVHIVSEPIAEKMNVTSGEYGAHVDEFVEAGFTAVPGTRVAVPRVREALVAMECRMTHHLRIGSKPPFCSHILGEVLHWHVDESVLLPSGRVDADVLRAVGRMGGSEYARTMDRFAIERPVIAESDPRSVPSYLASREAMAAKPMSPQPMPAPMPGAKR
jgi:flavin reductase (DIM6/NTAB) family NADH-FMN oxidoreductase RutF